MDKKKKSVHKKDSEHKIKRSSKKQKTDGPWKTVAIVLGVLLVIVVIMNYPGKTTAPGGGAIDEEERGQALALAGNLDSPEKVMEYNMAMADDDPYMGDEDAPVTIIEFSDFQCPYCTRFYSQTLPKIKKNYVDTGKVKFVYRDLALRDHPQAKNAAMASQCANDQGKFWEYHDEIFDNQRSLSVDKLKSMASDLRLDTAKFNDCLDSGKYSDEVDKDSREANAAGMTGTPGFVINGYILKGAQPYDVFESVIDALLAGEVPTKASPAGTGAAPSAAGGCGDVGADDQQQQPQLADTSNDPEIEFIIINDKTCGTCDSSRIIQVTEEQLFPSVNAREIDFSSAEAQRLVDDLGITALPAYIFDSNVAKAANYASVQAALMKKGSMYVIAPGASGASKILNPPGADDDAFKGDENAPVTIIEFSDFECSFCARFYTDTLPQITENYINTGKVKLVYRDFPLITRHPNAHKAAQAAECAKDQGKFWDMHDKLYENQRALSVSDLKAYAADLGLDTAAFNGCLDSGEKTAEVDADMQEASESGISGTPGFFVNGILISGALPYENFKQVIDAELEKV